MINFLLLLLPISAPAAESLRVVISGVEGEMLENVEAALAIPPGLVRDGHIDRGWLQRFRQQLPARAQQALEPFGYYSAQVDSRLESPDDGRLRLLVQIRPGEPVRVEEVRVAVEGAGEGRSALQESVAEFPLRRG
ncbi:MAG: outer membrane protein assembly factor, partial [Desulfuromonadales bacterium]|nr:outer membrane protein assembly factor [Desulfuromonadales bacterium]